jgi:outer membrane cobalamin receptor
MQHAKGTASRVVGALIGTSTRLSVFAILLVSNAVADEAIEELVVTTSRAPTYVRDQPGNIATVGDDAIEMTAHAHIHELLTRVSGVWVSRGSGQESLPSIRSPVLTGAGSCGAFLTLENGIPTRPSGFCNVNQLFEIFGENRNCSRSRKRALWFKLDARGD